MLTWEALTPSEKQVPSFDSAFSCWGSCPFALFGLYFGVSLWACQCPCPSSARAHGEFLGVGVHLPCGVSALKLVHARPRPPRHQAERLHPCLCPRAVNRAVCLSSMPQKSEGVPSCAFGVQIPVGPCWLLGVILGDAPGRGRELHPATLWGLHRGPGHISIQKTKCNRGLGSAVEYISRGAAGKPLSIQIA